MKTITIPASDCGCFIAGEIGPSAFDSPDGKPYPPFGIIIWYESKEAVKEAAFALFTVDDDAVVTTGKCDG